MPLPTSGVASVPTLSGCRACESPSLHIIRDFGPQHVVDFPASPSDVKHPPVPILLLRCGSCGLVQLAHTIPEQWRYQQYWYRCIGAEQRLFARVDGVYVHETAERVLSQDKEVELPCMTRTGQLEWRTVQWKQRQKQSVLKVEFTSGSQVTASPQHQWATLGVSGGWKRTGCGQPGTDAPTVLTRTDELKVGDRVPMALEMTRPSTGVDEDAIYTEDAGYLVGVYLAEGCEIPRAYGDTPSAYRLTTNTQTDAAMRARIAEFVTGRLHDGMSMLSHDAVTDAHLSGPVVCGLIRKFVRGKYSKGKRLTQEAWAMPLSFLRGVLAGWLDGDGHYEADNDRWRFNVCTNRALIADIAVACRLLGYRIRTRERAVFNQKGEPDQICGWIRTNPERAHQQRRLGEFGYVTVSRIWSIPEPKWTWDIHVGGDELFVLGNGIVTHNSGVNETMRAELTDVVKTAKRWGPKITPRSTVIDIGANDGTLLKAWKDSAKNDQEIPYRIAIEPADNLYDSVRVHAERVHQTCWPTFETAYLHDSSVDVVTAIACVYGSSRLPQFLSEVSRVLSKDGVFLMQFQDLLTGLQTCAIDYLVHEHLCWFSVWSLIQVLDTHGLQVQEVEPRAINGGSLRLIIQHKVRGRAPQPSVVQQVEREAAAGLLPDTRGSVWGVFLSQVDAVRKLIPAAVEGFVQGGGTVDLYAASTKACLLLQLCGLDSRLIRQAVERQPQKFGRYVGASGIPIVSEAEFRERPPTAALVGAYQFTEMIVQREDTYLRDGGMLIVPLPRPSIIRYGQKTEVA